MDNLDPRRVVVGYIHPSRTIFRVFKLINPSFKRLDMLPKLQNSRRELLPAHLLRGFRFLAHWHGSIHLIQPIHAWFPPGYFGSTTCLRSSGVFCRVAR